jgi:hypothetical protein
MTDLHDVTPRQIPTLSQGVLPLASRSDLVAGSVRTVCGVEKTVLTLR